MTLFIQTIRTVFIGVIADFLYTPIWWYTGGLWRQLRGVARSLSARSEALAIDVWIRNLFVPMYGQSDLTGRLISFFVRLAQIVGRMILLLIWTLVLLVWLGIWIAIPIGLGYLIWSGLRN